MSVLSAADLLKQKGDIATTDTVLFQLIDFYGLTKQFDSLESAATQMDKLGSIVGDDLIYFFNSCGGSSGTQFSSDYKIYNMKDDIARGTWLMQQDGYSLWDIWSISDISVIENYVKTSSYTQRISNLKSMYQNFCLKNEGLQLCRPSFS